MTDDGSEVVDGNLLTMFAAWLSGCFEIIFLWS